MRDEIDVPALIADESEIGERRFGPRQDDKVDFGGDGRSRRYPNDVDVGFGDQRIKIVEVGNKRQLQYCDADWCSALLRSNVKCNRVFCRQVLNSRGVGNDAETRQIGPLDDLTNAAGKPLGIAVQFINEESTHVGTVGRGQNGQRPDQTGDNAAAIDIAD